MTAPTRLRPAEEVVGASVPVTLGGREFVLLEPPSRTNREFQKRLTADVRDRMGALGPLDTVDQVIDAIADSAELMMDLLILYDRLGAEAWKAIHGDKQHIGPVLPEREWIDTHATDGECYRAIKKVTDIAFPFGGDLLRLVPELRPMLVQAVSKGVAAATIAMVASSPSTSSAPPSTDGSPTTSSAA